MSNPLSTPIIDLHRPAFDLDRVRADFPILSREINGKPLVYFDNAATSQKPRSVIETIAHYYEHSNSNIHRGIHSLSAEATQMHEGAREKVRAFIHAGEAAEIIFTRGTTEAINLVAATFGEVNIGKGDEVIVSTMEHHSNIVPWQMLCQRKGARLRVIPINEHGMLQLDDFEKLLCKKTKLVAVLHVSNALGTVTPVHKVIALAHHHGIPVLIDGAQAVPHMVVNVQELDCDFYAFSGHKLCGPTGIGVLYGKRKHLDAMPPWQGGGDMIDRVCFEGTTFNVLPYKFEAGTPDIAGAIALGAAIDYLQGIGMPAIADWEQNLLAYAQHRLKEVPGLRVIGTAPCKASLVSFMLDSAHPNDVGAILDQEGIAIRTGHHCAQPVMQRFNIPSTARASFAFYNTREEIDRMIVALHKVNSLFA